MTPGRVMINTVAVLFVLGLAWLLIEIRSIIILLILGIILAAAIEPLVYRLRLRGFTRGQAIMVVYAALLAILGLGVYLLVPPVIGQATNLINAIPQILRDLYAQALSSDNDFVRTAGARTLDRALETYEELTTSPDIEGSTALDFLTSVVGVVFTTISVMIVAFYWMTEKALIKRVVLGLFPLDKRDRAHALWERIELRLGGWTRGQLTLMAAIGLFSGIAYSPPVLDLEFWLPLAIWAGLTELIPFIGPILGGGAAVLVALSDSWEKALLVAAFALLLQQLEGAVLVPRVMRNAVGLTPLTVILAVLVGSVLLGPLGAVLAIPVAAAVQVLVQDLLHVHDDIPDIRERDDAPATLAPPPQSEANGSTAAPPIGARPLAAAGPAKDVDRASRD